MSIISVTIRHEDDEQYNIYGSKTFIVDTVKAVHMLNLYNNKDAWNDFSESYYENFGHFPAGFYYTEEEIQNIIDCDNKQRNQMYSSMKYSMFDTVNEAKQIEPDGEYKIDKIMAIYLY